MKEAISNSLQLIDITPHESLANAHLFNSSNYLINKDFEVKGWQFLKEGTPVGQVFFQINEGVAISGYQSTFGSFDLEKKLSSEELSFFLAALIEKLAFEGVVKLKIKNYPSYFKYSSLVEKGLKACGFENVLTEINQHVNIESAHFEDVANRSEVLRSNKCNQLGYQFKIATNEELPQIYDLVSSTLERNGNRPSMSYDGLKSVLDACTNNYILFSLWDGDKVIAATVSVKINDNIMYNFYHADHLEYRNVSSLTYLLKNIYQYCYENKFEVLDLGISSVNGIINHGLFNFKKARGAVSSQKNYYNLTI